MPYKHWVNSFANKWISSSFNINNQQVGLAKPISFHITIYYSGLKHKTQSKPWNFLSFWKCIECYRRRHRISCSMTYIYLSAVLREDADHEPEISSDLPPSSATFSFGNPIPALSLLGREISGSDSIRSCTVPLCRGGAGENLPNWSKPPRSEATLSSGETWRKTRARLPSEGMLRPASASQPIGRKSR